MLKVLGIDDEQGILDVVEIICNRVGLEFEGSLSGGEALELFNKGFYDIVIVDYFMEKINGDEVVRKIREYNENVYIILLTGYSNKIDGITALKTLDVDSYAEKNVNLNDLMLKLLIAIKSVGKYKLSENQTTNFGAKLRKVRELNGLDQKELASIINISRQAITNYENNLNTPKIKHVIRLSEYFNVPTDYFLK
jgi:CheY-like chemotaxis protein